MNAGYKMPLAVPITLAIYTRLVENTVLADRRPPTGTFRRSYSAGYTDASHSVLISGYIHDTSLA